LATHLAAKLSLQTKVVAMKRSMLIFATIFFLTACNNSGNNNGNKTKDKTDSLMDQVMEGHNAGMAKMEKISEAQKKIQEAIDSISKLPANLQKATIYYKLQLDSLLDRLKYADYAMEKWMEEFNMDSALDNVQERIKYLESEKIKIEKVKEVMINSLKKADSLLNKKAG
jgi:hypothetical protein